MGIKNHARVMACNKVLANHSGVARPPQPSSKSITPCLTITSQVAIEPKVGIRIALDVDNNPKCSSQSKS